MKPLTDVGGFPLGVRVDQQYRVSPPIELNSGDIVFLLSDGLMEVPAILGSLQSRFDGVAAPIQIIRENRNRRAQDIIGILFAACHFLLSRRRQAQPTPMPDLTTMEEFVKMVEQYDLTAIPDDITAVVIKVE
jgi:hypothetical protein